jgi:O-glycosyl hydrolase
MNMNPEQQRDLIKSVLGPAIKGAFPDMKLLIYDHNKGETMDWVAPIIGDPVAASYVDGTAVHWYDGDHFDQLALAHQFNPNKFILATEATAALSYSDPFDYAIHYAHDILGDINNFVVGWIDWNLMLNEFGGPLHIGPFLSSQLLNIAGSDSMMMTALNGSSIIPQTFYYAMGQISKFGPPDSVRIAWNLTGDDGAAPRPKSSHQAHGPRQKRYESVIRDAMGGVLPNPKGERQPGKIQYGTPMAGTNGTSPLEVSAFQTPSGTIVVVVLNTATEATNYTIIDSGQSAFLSIPAQAIQTLTYQPLN